LVTCTVKPVAVAVVVPNVGVNAAAREVAVTCAKPPTYPVLVVVILIHDSVPAATPVTVTKPVPLTTTEPFSALPVHV